jgi:CRP-like cAMP-binding protein
MAREVCLGYALPMSLKTVISLLQRHDLFKGLAPARLEVLAFTAERSNFEAGDTLFEAGEEAFDAYLIVEGQCVMHADGGFEPRAGEARAVRVDKGDLIGEMALFHEGRRKSTVRASSSVEALTISRYLFQRLMEEFPEMAGAVARALGKRLAATSGEMHDLAQALGRQENETER